MGGGVSGRASAHQARSGSPLAYKANSSGATGAIRLVGGGLTTPMKRIGAQGWHLFLFLSEEGNEAEAVHIDESTIRQPERGDHL